MKLLESITIHILLAFLCFFICGAMLWEAVARTLPAGVTISDIWFWGICGVISLGLAYYIPGTIARQRIRYWIRRLVSPGKEMQWWKNSHRVLSWLDSALLWQWERDQLAPGVLEDIEPFLRSEIPGDPPYRNLLKLLLQYRPDDPKYQKLLVENFLSQGITALDDAMMIEELWDESHPNEKLRRMWVNFALSQKIDVPWTERGYLWAMKQGGHIAEQVTHFLLPKLLSRHRYDDLAALVFLKAQELKSSQDAHKALLRIAQHHFKTSRDDELVNRVRDAVAGIPEMLESQEVEEEVDIDELIAKVKPTFGGFAWRSTKTAFRLIISGLASGLSFFFHRTLMLLSGLRRGAGGVELPAGTRRWVLPIGIGLMVIVIGWGVIQLLPLSSKESSPQDRNALSVFHSDQRFTVQVAAFRSQTEAENLVWSLRKGGEEAYWQKSDGEKPWYRVRVGGFPTQETAKKHAEDLINRKLIENYYIANFSDGYYSNP